RSSARISTRWRRPGRCPAGIGWSTSPSTSPGAVAAVAVGAVRRLVTSVQQVRVQDRGQVPLAEAGDDDDDQLPGVLGPLGDLERPGDRGAGGDADQQALLLRGAAGELDGGLRVDVDDLVVDRGVEDLRDEVGAQALDLVRAGV